MTAVLTPSLPAIPAARLRTADEWLASLGNVPTRPHPCGPAAGDGHGGGRDPAFPPREPRGRTGRGDTRGEAGGTSRKRGRVRRDHSPGRLCQAEQFRRGLRRAGDDPDADGQRADAGRGVLPPPGSSRRPTPGRGGAAAGPGAGGGGSQPRQHRRGDEDQARPSTSRTGFRSSGCSTRRRRRCASTTRPTASANSPATTPWTAAKCCRASPPASASSFRFNLSAPPHVFGGSFALSHGILLRIRRLIPQPFSGCGADDSHGLQECPAPQRTPRPCGPAAKREGRVGKVCARND